MDMMSRRVESISISYFKNSISSPYTIFEEIIKKFKEELLLKKRMVSGGDKLMEKLSKQPLLEVVFELHWKSKKGYPDPNYKLIIGSFYDHIKSRFPVFEPLMTASIPEEAIPPNNRIVQYRFWSKNKVWPVVQLGSGIITVNMNKDYESWNKFKPVIEEVIDNFLKSHPSIENLILEKLILRYIDVLPFDFSKNNVLDYIRNKLHVNLIIDLGDDQRKTKLSEAPINIDLKLEHLISEPEGILGFRFFKATIEGRDVLAMESYVISREYPQIEFSREPIGVWLDKAHNMTDFIFSSLIRGELLEELK